MTIESLTLKPLCHLSWRHCDDGFAAAWVVRKALKGNAAITAMKVSLIMSLLVLSFWRDRYLSAAS